MRRYALLIDGSNLFATLKELHFNLDFNKLLTFFDGELVRAMYFTAVPEDKTKIISLKPMWDHIQYNGYTMITKPTKEYTDPDTGATTVKGNMDVEMVLAAIDIARHVTDIVLVSGDGDFTSLVERLQLREGIRVSIMSSLDPPMVSDNLRRQADIFIDLGHSSVRSRLARDSSDRMERRFNFNLKR